MMTLDLWLLAIVLSLLLGGLFQGASGQLAKLLALGLAAALGLLLGPFFMRLSNEPRSDRLLLASLGIGVVVYLLAGPLLKSGLRRIVAHAAWGRADRLVGGLLGALRGLCLAWLLLLLLPSFNRALALSGSHLRLRTHGSRLYQFAQAHRPPRAAPRHLGGARQVIDRFQLLQLPLGDQ